MTKCTCLLFMKEDAHSSEVDAVVRYMIRWSKKNGEHQFDVLSKWVKCSEFIKQGKPTHEKHLIYFLPKIRGDNDTFEDRMICVNALHA
eukprot:15359695-Ditylum_brightwellii.AAC.1